MRPLLTSFDNRVAYWRILTDILYLNEEQRVVFDFDLERSRLKMQELKMTDRNPMHKKLRKYNFIRKRRHKK